MCESGNYYFAKTGNFYFALTENSVQLVPRAGLEPAQVKNPRDFKSLASTNSATPAAPNFLTEIRYAYANSVVASLHSAFGATADGGGTRN